MDVEARAFDIALILHADHEFNASTFAGRVTAGTLADIYAAITSAIGALSGPLHGGANEQVIKMLLEVGSLDNADRYVADKFASGAKIMGIGHAVYRTEDPRATHLRRMSEEIGKRQGDTKWFDISRRIEELTIAEMEKRGKKLRANVDFYSASVYYMLGMQPTSILRFLPSAGFPAGRHMCSNSSQTTSSSVRAPNILASRIFPTSR